MKTFETEFGTFYLEKDTLTMKDREGTIKVDNPENMDVNRLFHLYNGKWNDSLNESEQFNAACYYSAAVVDDNSCHAR